MILFKFQTNNVLFWFSHYFLNNIVNINPKILQCKEVYTSTNIDNSEQEIVMTIYHFQTVDFVVIRLPGKKQKKHFIAMIILTQNQRNGELFSFFLWWKIAQQ